MPLTIGNRDLESVVSKQAARRLRAFRRQAERLLPGQVSNVVLFGSRARGDAKRDSDYDIAVFVSGLGDPLETGHMLLRATHDDLLAGYHINPIALPADFMTLHTGDTLRYAISRDGIPVR